MTVATLNFGLGVKSCYAFLLMCREGFTAVYIFHFNRVQDVQLLVLIQAGCGARVVPIVLIHRNV